ncbi:tetratricopeptide repeat protein [Myxococcaceae bacterium GXIMD 01537]
MRSLRLAIRAVPLLLALAGWRAEAAPKRPRVDREAMREAIAAGAGDDEFASSASYAAFLDARLRQLSGDSRGAVDALRLALATDDGSPYLLTRLGEEYARLGELGKAERELRKVVERTPDYYPARVLLGRVLLEAGRPARAAVHLRRAVALRPHEPEAYLVLAQLHLEARQPDEAVRWVEALGAAVPGEATGYQRLGLALAERGDAARAERLLVRATERDPGDLEVWTVLARLYEASGRAAEAEKALSRALERDPDNREVLLSAGRVALGRGAVPAARAYFDRLLSLSEDPELTVKVAFAFLAAREPTSAVEVLDGARRARAAEPRLAWYAGLVHERLRRYSDAAAAYAEVPEASELFSDARVRRAGALSQAGDHGRALALYAAALQSAPGDVALQVLHARALERSGALARAEAALKAALAREASAPLYEALAVFYQRQGRAKDALALLRGAVERGPRDTALLYALGAAYERQGDDARSLAQMRAVLEMEPEHAAAMNFIGYVLARQGKALDEAERLVQRALELHPDTGAFLDSLGWVYFQRGELHRAVLTLERAAALSPEEPVILEHLGDAYRAVTRHEEAAGAWRRALEALALDPEAAEPAEQPRLLERKLKELSTDPAGR